MYDHEISEIIELIPDNLLLYINTIEKLEMVIQSCENYEQIKTTCHMIDNLSVAHPQMLDVNLMKVLLLRKLGKKWKTL